MLRKAHSGVSPCVSQALIICRWLLQLGISVMAGVNANNKNISISNYFERSYAYPHNRRRLNKKEEKIPRPRNAQSARHWRTRRLVWAVIGVMKAYAVVTSPPFLGDRVCDLACVQCEASLGLHQKTLVLPYVDGKSQRNT